MSRWLLTLKSAVLAFTFVLAGAAHAADEAVKVVYHISEAAQAARGLNNIRNHLAADPKAKVVVVTHGPGIDFLLQGVPNQAESPLAGAIADLAAKGVEFRVCRNTLNARQIDESKVVMEAKVVQSGVAEVARLQAREGFVYLRP